MLHLRPVLVAVTVIGVATAAAVAQAGTPLPEQKAFVDGLKKSLPRARPTRARRAGAAAPATPLPAPAAAPKAPDGDLSDGTVEGKLGDVSMRRANRVAAEILRQRMARSRPDDLRLLRDAVGADVVVVQGSYDRVQDVLRAVDIKHVVIPVHLLDKIDLLPTQTLMVNCPGRLSQAGIRKVRDFVRRGGYLVTTDWALTLVQKAFPGTIEHNLKRTKNDVVAVHVHDHKEPLLAHVKVMKERPRWWLEGASFPIRVVDKKRVRVLMSSDEMKKKYGEGAVVVAFPVDDGKVLHMTSHFYLQQSKLVAESERQKGSKFAKAAGLSDKELAELKKRKIDLDQVRVGELNSAYSMQQVSTNLLVEKQRQNKKLLEKYRGRIVANEVTLQPAEAPTPAPVGTAQGSGSASVAAGLVAPAKRRKLKKDYRVQILEEKGGKVRVRDLFGNEGWLERTAVK